MMANQIGKFFTAAGVKATAGGFAAIADHLQKILGSTHARRQSSRILERGGEGLKAPVRQASARFRPALKGGSPRRR